MAGLNGVLDEQPVVTVLMPVYNAAEFLPEAIESILRQTFVNFEFLIIDDGSTDDSVSIIESYQDNRIRLVKNENNLGISATLNKGIEIAKCEFIARMDADDISYPDRLQKQYDYMQKHHDCALLSTWAREVDENGNLIGIEKWPSYYYYYNLNFECPIYHPTVMYRRKAVLKVGGYKIPHCEDYDLWWRLARSFKIYNLSEVLLDYRSTFQSLSRVTHKTEYESAHQQLIIRNVAYYTDSELKLSTSDIGFLRYNIEIILLENDRMKAIKNCIRKLDYITNCILKKEKATSNKIDIQKAAWHKRNWTIQCFQKHLSKTEFLFLLISTKSWALMKRQGVEVIRKYVSLKH